MNLAKEKAKDIFNKLKGEGNYSNMPVSKFKQLILDTLNNTFPSNIDKEKFRLSLKKRFVPIIKQIKDQRKKYGTPLLQDHEMYEELYEFLRDFDVNTIKKSKVDSSTPKIIEPETFEDIFISQDDIDSVLSSLRKLNIINDKNEWIYGKYKGAIVAIANVLMIRGKTTSRDEKKLVYVLAEKFKTTISDRTIDNRPKYYETLLGELKTLIE